MIEKMVKMTKEWLSGVARLRRDIMRDSARLVGMKNGAMQKSRSESMCSVLELEEKIRKKSAECARLQSEINKLIDGIDDSLTRQVFYFRYVKCLPWKKVSHMTGGLIGEDGVRKVAERYLKRNG